ncbi:MAG: four helix bundle protein [Clostridia bacterium]|nr:four helix bundle protein [Clostridia bacterium]
METESWLKLIFSLGSIDEEIFKKYRNLCGRIRRMLTSSCIKIETKTPRATNYGRPRRFGCSLGMRYHMAVEARCVTG